jgi:hypothetical protein
MANRSANLNTNYRVRNVASTTNVRQGSETWKRVCACKTWMNHWRAGVLYYFPNARPDAYLDPPCYVRGCKGRGTKGAHVVEVDGRATQYWKIIPFCDDHNHYTFVDDVDLTVDAILVPANQVDTCMRNEEWKHALSVVKLPQG